MFHELDAAGQPKRDSVWSHEAESDSNGTFDTSDYATPVSKETVSLEIYTPGYKTVYTTYTDYSNREPQVFLVVLVPSADFRSAQRYGSVDDVTNWSAASAELGAFLTTLQRFRASHFTSGYLSVVPSELIKDMDNLTPERIMQVGMAFWPAKTLLSAVELGLFTALGDGAMTGAELRHAARPACRAISRFLRHAGRAGLSRARRRRCRRAYPQHPGNRGVPRQKEPAVHGRLPGDGQRAPVPLLG